MSKLILRPILALRLPEEEGGTALMPAINGGDSLCRTPTSRESKIPLISRSCPPPAPKKKPRRGVLCKRRLSEIDLFRVEADALDRLFRRRDELSMVMPSSSSSSLSHPVKKLKQSGEI